MTISLLITALVLFALCSALLSGSETALFSLSSLKIRSYQHSTDKTKNLIASLVLRPRDLIVTILILNILVNILIQNVASNIFSNVPGWLLKVGIPLIITLFLGEIIPKSIALRNNTALAPIIAPTISLLQKILKPLRVTIIFITSYVSRTLFFFLHKGKDISSEELKHILKTSEKHGVLKSAEAKLVKGYINLQDALVKELMQPREDIVYYNNTEPISALHKIFGENGYSRIPVCNGNLESIAGIISARIFLLHRHELSSPNDMLPFLRKPFFVPETTQARILLKQYEEHNETIALVVDEYGSITGIITREDLFEVVVGKFAEYREEKPHYTTAGDGIIIASGKLELSEFEEIFGIPLKSENNMVSIGGWLTEQFGDLPKTGMQHIAGKFLFQVLSADPNRVRRIYIRKLSDG